VQPVGNVVLNHLLPSEQAFLSAKNAAVMGSSRRCSGMTAVRPGWQWMVGGVVVFVFIGEMGGWDDYRA